MGTPGAKFNGADRADQHLRPAYLPLRHLRALDERTERIEAILNRLVQVVGARFGAMEARMLGLETRMSALEDWSHDVTGRLDRIERRLNLVEAD